MAELTRTTVDAVARDGNTPTRCWVVSGPGGAITLDTVMGIAHGVFIHTPTDAAKPDDPACYALDGVPCSVDALVSRFALPIYDLRHQSDDAVYDALADVYRREWPGDGRCGESVPQAGYDTDDIAPNAGSAS